MNDRDRLALDIQSEIADHLERRVRDLRESGMSEAEALTHARSAFGDLDAAKRDLLTIDARIDTRRRRARVWSGVGGDVRTAARRLAGRRPLTSRDEASP